MQDLIRACVIASRFGAGETNPDQWIGKLKARFGTSRVPAERGVLGRAGIHGRDRSNDRRLAAALSLSARRPCGTAHRGGQAMA